MTAPDNNCAIAISGCGVAGGCGCGSNALLTALRRGDSAAAAMDFHHPDGAAPLLAQRASSDELARFVNRRALRRIDHFSRLALLAGLLALEDAAVAADQRATTGVIVASGYGATTTTLNFLDSVIDGGDGCASPTAFSNSLHNVAAAYLSMHAGVTGPNLTVSQFELSFAAALATAITWLRSRRCDTVLVGGVDEHNFMRDYCHGRYGGTAVVPGEGAAFFVLRRAVADADLLVDMPRFSTQPLPPSAAATAVIVGSDGCGRRAELDGCALPQCHCTPCYGVMPVGQAFDLAAALLMLRHGALYCCPATAAPPEALSCIQNSATGEWAAIDIYRGDSHA